MRPDQRLRVPALQAAVSDRSSSSTELEHVVSRLLRVAPCAAHDDRRQDRRETSMSPSHATAPRNARIPHWRRSRYRRRTPIHHCIRRSACNPPVAPTVRALVVSMRRAILRMNWTGISIAFVGLRHSCGTTRREIARKTVKFPKKIGSSGWTRTSNPPVNSNRGARAPSLDTETCVRIDRMGS
jgi:hypothetical protein